MGVEELNILPGLRKVDEWFGEVEVYYSTAQLSFLLDGLERFESVEFELSYQGCAEAGLCYPPVTQRYVLSNGEFVEGSKEVRGKASLELEKREEQKLADALLKESVGWSLFLFFIGGIALAFTPCVFPMIPILSSIIVGQGSDLPRYRAFALSGSMDLARGEVALGYGVAANLNADGRASLALLGQTLDLVSPDGSTTVIGWTPPNVKPDEMKNIDWSLTQSSHTILTPAYAAA